MLRTELSPKNCGDIRLQYIKAGLSSMGGEEEHEISHSPTSQFGGRTKIDGLSQFHRVIGVRSLFVDVTRGFAEQSDVKMVLRRHTLAAGTQGTKS